MNCKNANQELGFDIFAESNYNLHWSFSNFNRTLMVAGLIARLPVQSRVLELGAGSSQLKLIVHHNFERPDIEFFRVDGDNQYKGKSGIIVADITTQEFDERISEYAFEGDKNGFDAVVFMEVIEHLSGNDPELIIERISSWLKPEGHLFFTTPTPPCYGKYEAQVWPTDHEREFTLSEIYGMINSYFKITKEIGWSLEEREYNKLIEKGGIETLLYAKLKDAFPESFIRAIVSCIAPVEENRQVLLVCRKRRIANGRFTSA